MTQPEWWDTECNDLKHQKYKSLRTFRSQTDLQTLMSILMIDQSLEMRKTLNNRTYAMLRIILNVRSITNGKKH